MKFLSSPESIRKCLVDGLQATKSLDAAVAFIGRDWADFLGTFPGSVRIVCWLSSPNTNPYAVEQMMQHDRMRVCQLPAMHAKVYILKGNSPRCIVGSANLTGAALSEENASGQYEAAVTIDEQELVQTVACWFEKRWEESNTISDSDLSSAKVAWKKARSSGRYRGRKKKERKDSRAMGSNFPLRWTPSRQLINLSDQVRDLDLSEFDKYSDLLVRIVDRSSTDDVEELISSVAEWTRHAATYKPALQVSKKRIRNAFTTLFDRSRPVEDRLRELNSGGASKIDGFGLASLTMILYWRFPTEYPPFNRRTQKFLKDFKFDRILPKTLSPSQYRRWIDFAQELSARLRLPSAGHIDRLVWEYTHDLEI